MSTDILKITIQKEMNGQDYVQIMSKDQTSINIVLIADTIIIKDVRK